MYQIDQTKQLEILRWLMYAWDGQWLGRTAAVYGAGEASKLNSRVRSAFGKIEMKALLALLGKPKADNLADATDMLKTYFQLVFGERGFQGQFHSLEAAPSGGIRVQVTVEKMMALDTLKKVAKAAGENPTLACELLWSSWLETLLPDAQLQITVRSSGMSDLYQIDSMSEVFTDEMPRFAAPAFTPAELANPGSYAGQSPATNPQPSTAEMSPIAAALQIPLEQITPPATASPYATGPVSYSPASTPLVGTGEPSASNAGRGGRINLSDLANLPPTASNPPASQAIPPPDFAGAVMPPAAFPPPPNFATPQAFPPPMTNLGQPPAGALGVDPTSGRMLFSSTPEADAKQKMMHEKSKNVPRMSRMFMSKEAKELLARSPDTPALEVTSLAANIDLVLQRRLNEARAQQPGYFMEQIRVIGGPQDTLQIVVGQMVYQSVGDVPPGPVRDILQQAVTEWSERQG